MYEIDGETLSINEVGKIARRLRKVQLSDPAKKRVERSHKWVEEIVDRGEPVYGINTGFGCFADCQITVEETRHLNRNLILSHAVGTGDWLEDDLVRAAMLIRANTLAKGHSGVRLVLPETLCEMLNQGVTPLVPSQGSLGSSGDLAPLSHLGLVLTTDDEDVDEHSGTARFQGEVMSGKQAMAAAGLDRIILEFKEGIALNNGATFSAAAAALACLDAEVLITCSEIALAMSLEALLGVSSAFDARIHEARQHPGQIASAGTIRRLIKGSTLLDCSQRVQDAYSLRCAPQVVGPIRETLWFINQIIEREINAATDNPLLFDEGEALSGGNFHGEPIGLAMDYLGIAITELAGISERRVFRMTDQTLNCGLPAMLVANQEEAGVNSGLMMLQYTAAALVLENRTLSGPDSVHSLPTSANQEDHNANAMTAALHTRRIIQNTLRVLAIELYTAARALTLRLQAEPDARLGVGTEAALACIRDKVPYQAGDTLWGPEIDQVEQLIKDRSLLGCVKDLLADTTQQYL